VRLTRPNIVRHHTFALHARLVIGFAVGLALPLAGQQKTAPSPNLQEQLNHWYRNASRAAPGEWGVAVGDETGRLLWSANATRSLTPASAVKLFTTGFARTVLGSEARQVTRVVGTGYADPETGTWIGTWALELNGDPTLERPGRSGPMLRDLATQLHEQGVRRLLGPLELQSAAGLPEATYPSVWLQRHRGRRYAPLIGSVTLNENVVAFTVSPGTALGEPPIVADPAPEGVASLVSVEAKTVQGSRDRLRILIADGGRYRITGTMGIRARKRYFAGGAREPRTILAATWQAALDSVGIEWVPTSGMSTPSSSIGQLTLAEIVSPPLDSIVAEINEQSINIGAESLLLWAGGSTEEGARRLTEHVKQVTGEALGINIVDGSGLSGDDRATANSFVQYLARFPETEEGKNFPLLLPANGSGTLKRLQSRSLGPGVVRAKTGTLGNVSSLVGYLGHKDGVLLISMLYNGRNVYAAKQHQWLLFKTLGAQGTPIVGDQSSVGEMSLGGENRAVVPLPPPPPPLPPHDPR